MAEEQNTNTDDSFEPNLNTYDSPEVRARISATENEVFLRDLFGIYLPNTIDETEEQHELAESIAHKVVNVIDDSRTQINRAQLENVLEQNISRRVNASVSAGSRISGPSALLDSQYFRNVRAVAEAIRESIPAAVMDDMLRYGLPAFVPREKNQHPHKVRLQNVSLDLGSGSRNYELEIDTRHQLWRKKYKDDELLQLLKRELVDNKKTLAYAGIKVIRPPVAEDATLQSEADVQTILNSESTGINLNIRYNDIRFTPNTAPDITFYVNTEGLVRHRTSSGDLIASIATPTDLKDLLEIDDEGIQDFINIDPSDSNITPALWQDLSNHIFTVVSGSIYSSPLAIQQMTLQNIQNQVGEQHHIHSTLREGSDNHMAAAMAGSIVRKYKDIRDVIGIEDISEKKKELKETLNKRDIAKILAESTDVSIDAPIGWEDARTNIGGYPTAMTEINNLIQGNNNTAGDIKYAGEEYPVPAGTGIRERDKNIADAKAWVNTKYKEQREIVQKYERLKNKLQYIFELVTVITSTTTELHRFFNTATTPPTPNYTEFTNNVSYTNLLQKLKQNPDLNLKEPTEYDTDIEQLKKQIKNIENGNTPKGAEAQHLIIKEYLKRYQGMSDSEAASGANILRSRSQLDTEMSELIQQVSTEIHGDHEEPEPRRWYRELPGARGRDMERIRQVAQAAKIPVDENGTPRWEDVRDYNNIMAAYFTLRKMSDGDGVPWMMRLSDRQVVRQQMHELTQVILKRHARAMINDFGPSLGLTDAERKKVLQDPTKQEHQEILFQILEGEVPALHAKKVEKVLEVANKNTFAKRRFVSRNVAKGVTTGLGGAVSATKALAYGNNNWSLRGFLRGSKNIAGNSAGWMWNNKAPIGKIVALSVLGGGIGLAIGGAAFAKDFSKRTGGSDFSRTMAA